MSDEKKLKPKDIYISGNSPRKEASTKTPEEPASLDELETANRVAAVLEFFDQFFRGIKTIHIYRHNTAHYGEYLQKAYQILEKILQKYDSIALKVTQLGFDFLNTKVYEEDATEQNIGHKFYRDGVRILIFRNGISAKELLDFVMICLTNFRTAEFLHDDMVSLMWKQEFQHIEYVVVETFAVGAETQEEARAEVDKIVNFLYQRLTSQSKDTFHFARLSLEDLDIELNDVEQAKGVVVKGTPASAEDKARIQQQLEEEDENRMLPKLVVILFKVLDEEMDQELGQTLEEVFVQLLDSFLMHEDFRSINQILRKFKGMRRKQIPAANIARVEQIEERFVAKMAEAERINRIGQILDTTAEIKNPQEVYLYFSRLDENAISPMLQALEQMERIEARRLFCDALVTLGKDHLDVFERRFQSPKANLVRDMVYIIDKLNPPNKLMILTRLLKHPNLAIRLESLSTIGSGSDDACRPYVMKALFDQDTQMRITAAKLLPNFDLGVAAKTLLSIVKDPNFQKRPTQEQKAIYSALIVTNVPEVLEYLREQLRSSALLAKKKLSEHKQNIVEGLALSGSITAYKFLRAELEEGLKEEELTQAAERACNRLKTKLLGADAGGKTRG